MMVMAELHKIWAKIKTDVDETPLQEKQKNHMKKDTNSI